MAKRRQDAKPIDSDKLPGIIHGCAESCGEPEFIEAAGENGAKLKKFSGVAYTGGLMSVGYGFPVVLDLTGIQQGGEQIAALMDHDSTQIVGHLKAEIGTRKIKVNGVLSGEGVTEAAAKVAALSANDFPWQMSVGVAPNKLDFVERDASAVVNGRTINGPAYIVRAGILREVSFVAIGADSNTSGKVAASINQESMSMNPFDKWLEAAGFDKSKLTADQLGKLEAAYNLEAAPPATPATKPIEAANDPTGVIRAKAAAEMSRIAAIQDKAKDHPAIQAKAIAEGWDSTRTELEVLRASRPAAPAIHSTGGAPIAGEVLHAAFANTLRLPNVEKDHKPEALEAAHRAFRGKLGLQQLVLICAAQNGMSVSPGTRLTDGNLREALRYAFAPPINASFSTLSLPEILSNVANKTLLDGYMEEDQTWREVAEVVSMNDFKTHTAYRLLDDMEYQELSPTGEIQHGGVGEETIERSIDTFARMFVITRKNIINDDLGAFNDLRNRIGRGRAQKFNKVFWTAFINNSSFFTTARTNYFEGATTNLGSDGVGLGLGVKTFRKMTSPTADGTKRVGIGYTPTILLCPPELEGVAESLYRNQNLGAVASSSANIYGNKYKPVVQNRLSDSAFTGYSTTAWYLFGSMLKPMWAGFLNGNQTPTVESAEADFNTLGIQLRGYHDFGAGQNEYLAGCKSKGAA